MTIRSDDEGQAPRLYVEAEGQLKAYDDTKFASEEELQALLERHVDLLGGELMDADDPPRFILVQREMEVPDRDGASGRWAIDHLFVDQNAIPTFVEVKRASDSRIRREVIGQMLDYAANGSKWWNKDTLRESTEATFKRAKKDYATEMASLLGNAGGDGLEQALAEFWSKVEGNLKEGRVRLIFAADRLPSELVTVIEFLNRAMGSVEVLGLQIQQFSYDSKKIFIPRVRGLLESKAPAGREPPVVNEAVRDFLREVKRYMAEEHSEVVVDLMVTTKPRKELSYYQWNTPIGSYTFKAHFGGYDSETWSPIVVGLQFQAIDTAARDRWERLLLELSKKRDLPASTTVKPWGKVYVNVEKSFEWSGDDDALSEAFAKNIADTLAAYIGAILPELRSQNPSSGRSVPITP